ncbi:MAG: hypothetical protein IKF91_03340 [Bacilli bacterium]|nr:hypothetical protein [Bacilli bacterium]
MKKGKILACIGLASLILPLSVNAANDEISKTKSSSIDATINSVNSQTEEEGYVHVSWGDFKFNYSYDSDTGVSSWTPVTAAGDQEQGGYVPASNEVNVSNSGMAKTQKTTLTFNTNITGVNAQIFREIVDNKSGNIDYPLMQIPDGTVNVEKYKSVEYDINLLGGDYETVKSEFDNGSKKIGTFTVTIEDVQ